MKKKNTKIGSGGWGKLKPLSLGSREREYDGETRLAASASEPKIRGTQGLPGAHLSVVDCLTASRAFSIQTERFVVYRGFVNTGKTLVFNHTHCVIQKSGDTFASSDIVFSAHMKTVAFLTHALPPPVLPPEFTIGNQTDKMPSGIQLSPHDG